MTAPISTEVTDDGIAILTLNRAPVNALVPAFLEDIAATLDSLATDARVHAAVLTSGLGVLSAGFDLKAAQAFTLADETDIVDHLNTDFATMYAFPKPLITAANGAAIAGGLFFVLTADYTVAVPQATFGLAEVRVGANFPVGPLEIARDALSPEVQRRLMLGGHPVDATDARTMGIVDEIAEPEALMDRALTVARDYAKNPPLAYAAIKAQLRQPALAIIHDAIDNGSDPTRAGWFTAETKAAMAAMISDLR